MHETKKGEKVKTKKKTEKQFALRKHINKIVGMKDQNGKPIVYATCFSIAEDGITVTIHGRLTPSHLIWLKKAMDGVIENASSELLKKMSADLLKN